MTITSNARTRKNYLLTEWDNRTVQARTEDNRTWQVILGMYSYLYLFISCMIQAFFDDLTNNLHKKHVLKSSEKACIATGYACKITSRGRIKKVMDYYNRSNKKGHYKFNKTPIPLMQELNTTYLTEPEAELYVFYYCMYKAFTKSHCKITWYIVDDNAEDSERIIKMNVASLLCYENASVKIEITPTKKAMIDFDINLLKLQKAVADEDYTTANAMFEKNFKDYPAYHALVKKEGFDSKKLEAMFG